MKKFTKRLLSLSVVFVMLGTCVAYARTSYDITNISSAQGGNTLLTTARRTFTGATLVTSGDWVPTPTTIDGTAGVTAQIVSGDAPAPGGGECLKMTSTGPEIYLSRIMQENQSGGVVTGGTVIATNTNSTVSTGRYTNKYRVSMLVKTENLGEGVLPFLEVSFTAASTSYKAYDCYSQKIDTKGEWKEIDCVYTIPEYISGKARSYQFRLHLPGEGTVYWDHVRIWTDDFNYYGPATNASTITKLSSGTINALYEPIDTAHAVGDTVTMITGLYETIGAAKKLIAISPIVSTTKVEGKAIQLMTSINVGEDYAKTGTTAETFLFKSLTDPKPVASKEILTY